jgi:uncharacterized protein involved in copper resistance
MNNKSFVLACSLLLTTTAVLAAEPPKPSQQPTPTDHSQMQHGEMDHSKMDHGKQPADHQKMAANEFAALDKNKDGKLNKTELAKDSAVRPHFDMLDSDKNGSLSSAEFAGYHSM